MNAALILSGGVGARFGAAVPKQYIRIRRKMVIEYVIEAAMQAETIDVVMIAGAPCPQLKALQKKYGFCTAPGGSVRNETLQNGLTALRDMGCERVIILDAVRPLVTGLEYAGHISLTKSACWRMAGMRFPPCSPSPTAWAAWTAMRWIAPGST